MIAILVDDLEALLLRSIVVIIDRKKVLHVGSHELFISRIHVTQCS